MDDNLLVMVSGVLLSLAFGYVPGLSDWYNALDRVRRAQVMAVLLVAAAAGVFVAGCYSPWQAVSCDADGAWGLVELLVLALMANQATYQLAVKPAQANSG